MESPGYDLPPDSSCKHREFFNANYDRLNQSSLKVAHSTEFIILNIVEDALKVYLGQKCLIIKRGYSNHLRKCMHSA